METALIIGVGPGLGTALAKRFARAGLHVAIAARNRSRLEALLPDLEALGAPAARAYACDITSEEFVHETFRNVTEALGVPRLVVFNAGSYIPKGLLDTELREFEHSWRSGCLGGFLVGQCAVRALYAAKPRADGTRGTLLFTGATASLRGSAGFHNVAVSKFGLRALAQSMAREFGPEGIHVAHVIVDGQIQSPDYNQGQEGADNAEAVRLEPDAIAENYWHLHCQDRSAWTQELDLRPWQESF